MHKKLFLLAFLGIFGILFVSALPVLAKNSVPQCVMPKKIKTFVNKFNIPSYYKNAVSLAKADNNGVAIAGTIMSKEEIKDSDMFVSRLDESGNNLWTKIVKGPGQAEDEAVKIISVSSGYLLVGYSVSTETNTERVLLAKLSAAGNKEWSVIFGAGSLNRPLSLAQTANGDYAVLTRRRISDEGDANDLVLYRLNSSGNMKWSINLGYTDITESLYSLAKTSDNGLILTANAKIKNYAGRWSSFSSLTKLDKDGNEQWSKILETIPKSYWSISGYQKMHFSPANFTAVIETDDGYLATGQIGSNLLTDSTFKNLSQADIFVTKVDKNGKHKWTEGFDLGGAEKGLGITKTSDGGYLIFGEYAKILTNQKMVLLKISSSGGYEWNKILSRSSEAGDFAKADDKGYFAGGVYDDDFQIFKLNAFGDIHNNCSLVGSLETKMTDWTRYVLISKADASIAKNNSASQDYGLNTPLTSINSKNVCTLGEAVSTKTAEKMHGDILLQTEKNGQAWYVNASNLMKYYLGKPKRIYEIFQALLPKDKNNNLYYKSPKNNKTYYITSAKTAYNTVKQTGAPISNRNLAMIPACLPKLTTKHQDPNHPKTWIEINYEKISSIKLTLTKSKKANKYLLPALNEVFDGKVKIKDEMAGGLIDYQAYRKITKKDVKAVQKNLETRGFHLIDKNGVKQITMAGNSLTLVITFNVNSENSALIEVTY